MHRGGSNPGARSATSALPARGQPDVPRITNHIKKAGPHPDAGLRVLTADVTRGAA